MESTIEMKIKLISNESEKVVALQIPCTKRGDPAKEDESSLAVTNFCTNNNVFKADY